MCMLCQNLMKMVQLKPEELIDNIKTLVRAASNENPAAEADHTICEKRVTHKFVTPDGEEWFTGNIPGRHSKSKTLHQSEN